MAGGTSGDQQAEAAEMNEHDKLFGCPTFDECDYCVCVDCSEVAKVVEVAPSIPRKPKPKAEVAPKAGPQAASRHLV